MLIADDCDVKQIFRNDFVDMVNRLVFVDMINRLVNDTDYYTFQLYVNSRSQGPDWYNQYIQSACSAREYIAFINALDKQIEREGACIVYGGTCDDACIWIVCAE